MAITAKDCANLRLHVDRFGQTLVDNQLLLELIELAESTFDQEGKKKGWLRQEIDDLEGVASGLEGVVSDLESSIRTLQRMNR